MKRLLPILGLLLCFARPASATITFVQVHGNAACGGVTSCTVSGFSPNIAAGSFIFMRTSASTASAGASGAGTWTLPSGCTTNTACNESDATGGSVSVAYIASTTGSVSSITCTTGSTMNDCAVAVYTFTGSSMSMDVGAVRAQAVTGTSYAGQSAGTLTGTNDLILQYGVTNGDFSACPNSSASPADFTNGNGLCGLINSTNNAAGTWTLSLTGRAALGAIAFKEAAAAGVSTMPAAVF